MSSYDRPSQQKYAEDMQTAYEEHIAILQTKTEKVVAEYEKLLQKYNEREEERRQFESQAAESNLQLKSLAAELKQTNETCSCLQGENAELHGRVRSLTESRYETTKEQQKQSSMLDDKNVIISRLTAQLQEKENELGRAHTELQQLQDKFLQAEAQRRRTEQEHNTLNLEAAELLDKLNMHKALIKDLQKDNVEKKNRIASLEGTQIDALKSQQQHLEDMADKQNQITLLTAKAEEQENEMRGLKERMEQLLAAKHTTHSKHLLSVQQAHTSHIEQLKTEIDEHMAAQSALRAELEKSNYEKKQLSSELQLVKAAVGGTPNSSVGGDQYASHLQTKLQTATHEKDDLLRKLDSQSQKHRSECREKDLAVERLHHLLEDKDRRIVKLEAALTDLRDDLDKAHREHDIQSQELHSVKLARDDAQRKGEFQLVDAKREYSCKEDRLKAQLEDALCKCRTLEGNVERLKESKFDKEKRLKQELELNRQRHDTRVDEMQQEMNRQATKIHSLQDQLHSTQQQQIDIKHQNDQLAEQNEQNEQKSEIYKHQLNSVVEKLSVEVTRKTELRTRVAELELEVEKWRLDYDRLQRDRERFKEESQLYSLALNRLTHNGTSHQNQKKSWEDLALPARELLSLPPPSSHVALSESEGFGTDSDDGSVDLGWGYRPQR
eukprot:TRINITY_DN62667_c0_g1_i1.p1 TRINITY_DN62667_c0_g1~~TRINITY_DN62667_c0_g1_i1.p1  ORF type:complete len:667 (+),score=107.90 TRINITY_DN62667_c0_g1_i1:33-2033(+)